MKKKFIIFILAILCLIPFNTFAEEIDKNKTVGDLSYEEIIDYVSNYLKFDNFVLIESNSGSPRYFFLPLYDDMKPVINNRYLLISSSSRDITTTSAMSLLRIISKDSLLYKAPSFSTGNSSITITSHTVIFSTIDITDYQNGSVYFAKNFSYKKKVVCPDVNVDIPITKEEFYVLLMLVSLLILLLFFKWCFPNKGGKDV